MLGDITKVLTILNDSILNDKYKIIKNKYIMIINEILEKKKNTDYKQFILDINKDLKPFLEELNQKSHNYVKEKELKLI